MWISRMAWIEVLAKGNEAVVRDAMFFFRALVLTKLMMRFPNWAAALRPERPG